jgi:hypothetical protein
VTGWPSGDGLDLVVPAHCDPDRIGRRGRVPTPRQTKASSTATWPDRKYE